MPDLGWQDLDSILDGLAGAAVAASIAGASEILDGTKNAVQQAAPVGKRKRTVHFANPRIAGGRTREAGRTRDTVNFAYPDIDVTKLGDRVLLEVQADIVMAPQGIYQNDPGKIVTVRPRRPLKRLGWLIGPSRGIWPLSAVTKAGGGHVGWLDAALNTRTFAASRMRAAFAQQFTSGGQIRPQSALVLTRPFIDTSSAGSWFGSTQPRSKVRDLALRRRWQAASSRAAGQWRRAVERAIGRF